jgi:hypothetical protein
MIMSLEPPADELRHSIRCTVRLPDPEKDDPGQIIEGSYSLSGNVLRVYDETGRLLGTDTLKPGDNAEIPARKLLREKFGKHQAFNQPIHYPPRAMTRARSHKSPNRCPLL